MLHLTGAQYDCYLHTNARMQERYGEDLSMEDYVRMCNIIQNDNPKQYPVHDHGRRRIFEVEGVLCVWDERKQVIITVLMENFNSFYNKRKMHIL